jgi:15-cis-phytoene synthase
VTQPRPVLVAWARDTISKGSKSFRFASRLFDHTTRERAWLLYSWCRHCDDVADGQELGHGASRVGDAQLRLSHLRVQSARAMGGEATGEPPFDALGLVAAECAIPDRFIHDHLEGFALDAREWRPRTEEDLIAYCYHVAGVVGSMMAAIMGVDPTDEATMHHARDLGIAFQLANIARDIVEDAAVGRCYVPEAWLTELDLPPGELMRPFYRERLAVIAKRLCKLAETYEESGRMGARALPFRARWAVLSAAGIYGDIAREVAARGPQAWDRRVVIGKPAKLKWVARALAQASRS